MFKMDTRNKYLLAGFILMGALIPAVLDNLFSIATGLTGKEILYWTLGGFAIFFIWLGSVRVTDPMCER